MSIPCFSSIWRSAAAPLPICHSVPENTQYTVNITGLLSLMEYNSVTLKLSRNGHELPEQLIIVNVNEQ